LRLVPLTFSLGTNDVIYRDPQYKWRDEEDWYWISLLPKDQEKAKRESENAIAAS